MKRKVILIRFVFIIILLHFFHKKTEKKKMLLFFVITVFLKLYQLLINIPISIILL